MDEQESLQKQLDGLREQHGVVGASLALFSQGRVELACSGILNLNTKVPVTTDSVFQIGSISKVFTATLMMQLVDEGRVDLDEPVRSYLPGFVLSNTQASRTITTRHLLSHTSGIEGDFFPDDSRWRSAVERYVDQCFLLPQLHPVGEYFSYCNSGFSIAGRIIEVLTGQPWHMAVRERIFRPLEMQWAVAEPAELPRFRVATGHIAPTAEPAQLKVAEKCFLPPGLAPSGSVLAMSSLDLMRFARCHLAGGIMDCGKRLFSEAATNDMQRSQVCLPPHFPLGATDWGLGWYLGTCPGKRMFGHNGGTIGQYAYLNVYPEHGFAICLLTNSPSAAFFTRIEKELLAQRVGLKVQCPNRPESMATTMAGYCGYYQNLGGTLLVTDCQSGLRAQIRSSAGEYTEVELEPYAKHCFRSSDNGHFAGQILQFIDDKPGHKAPYVLAGSRLFRRVEDPGFEY